MSRRPNRPADPDRVMTGAFAWGEDQRMQRGVSAEARGAIPGVFQTIAAAMSLLLVHPVLLAVPLLVDLYLWLGVRFSPERLLEPLATVLATQPGLEAEALTTTVRTMSQEGNLAEFVGWFIPSLVSSLGAANLAAPWVRPVVDPGSAGAALLLALAALALGAVGLVTFQVMMARVVREGPALGSGLGGMIGVATLRYVGFLAVLIPVLILAVIAGTLIAGIFSVISTGLGSLAALAMMMVIFVVAILLTFVVDAIVLAEVGPVRAVELSVGVVRRFPWGSIGLLLVSGISLITLPELAQRVAVETTPGVLLAILVYAFIATGLAFARMQFFADRLRQWQPGLVRNLNLDSGT